MSTFELAPVVDEQRQVEGCTIVLGALLRRQHPADAAAWVARLLAEARIPADLVLLGAHGDTARVALSLNGVLQPETESSWLTSSGCAIRVLEAPSEDDSEVLP